jgi:3-dehydroquinate synthase
VYTVNVELGDRSYGIHIGAGLLSDAALLGRELTAAQIMVVSNDVVAPLYLDAFESRLSNEQVETLILPDGEQHKTLDTFARIIDRLVEKRFHRDSCIVALGGGVVGDVAGFAAASYQRGIGFVQIPTTLLAQVDSSVGGKTAVNHPKAKNMIGAFYQPSAVITDTDTLKTLPRRELSAGLAEIVKYGLIVDRELFDWLNEHVDALLALDADALVHAIRRSCEIKAAIVADDELERGRRALLNLGHTFGHALETIGRFDRWLHGEAVAIGMVLAARVSAHLGWVDDEDCRRIAGLLERAGLPVRADGVGARELLAAMQLDKKADRAGLKLILLEGIGNGVIRPPPRDLERIVQSALTE